MTEEDVREPLPGASMWDERYRAAPYAYGFEPNGFLSAQAYRLRSGMRALVPGDGEGRNGVWLATQGLQVDTLDLSGLGVAKAKRLAESKGVTVNAIEADALLWEWPEGAYDVVALIFLHLIEPQRRALHTKALGSLKPGGLVVLEAFRPEQIERQAKGVRGGPRDPALLYSLEALRSDFADGDVVTLEEADASLDEGALHQGLSAVVRAIVRKRDGRP